MLTTYETSLVMSHSLSNHILPHISISQYMHPMYSIHFNPATGVNDSGEVCDVGWKVLRVSDLKKKHLNSPTQAPSSIMSSSSSCLASSNHSTAFLSSSSQASSFFTPSKLDRLSTRSKHSNQILPRLKWLTQRLGSIESSLSKLIFAPAIRNRLTNFGESCAFAFSENHYLGHWSHPQWLHFHPTIFL